LEKRKKLHYFKLFYRIVYLNDHKFNEKFLKDFSIKAKLLTSTLITMHYSLTLMAFIVYSLLFLYAFYTRALVYSFITHNLCHIIMLISIHQIFSIFNGSIIVCFLISTYLSQRFEQIYQNIQTMAKKGI